MKTQETIDTPPCTGGKTVESDRYRTLLENVPEVVFALDMSGRFTYLNRAGEQVLGYERGSALGMNIAEIVVPGERVELEEMLDAALAGKTGLTHRLTTLTRDGRRLRLDFTTKPLVEEGRTTGFQGIARDITEREAAERELRLSEERFCQFAEHTREVFYMCDPDFRRIIYVSPAYEAVWGRTCASLYLDPQSWMESVHPEDRASVEKALQEVAEGKQKDLDYRIVRPDGNIRSIWGRAFPMREGEGPVYRVLNLAEDITERKKLEEQLYRAQKMEAVGQLAGGIAHDFNNLLTAILGHAELVMEQLEGQEELRTEVEEIVKAGERAAAMTRQLLAFSRRQVLQPKILDLNSTVTDMERMLRRLIGEHIQLATALDPELGRVRADPAQLQQVLMNLVVNARDAMPQGGSLTIETTNVELDATYCARRELVQPGSYVMLAVSDTGCGMDAATQARIFEPFFTTKQLGEGTGLGLSTVYGIVKQSGGFIWVYSEPGHGTTFKVYLPRIGAESEAPPIVVHTPASPRRSETVLLVEDQREVRNLIRRVLEGRGHKVLDASEGAEAIRIAQEHAGPIHLLLTDLVLPKLSGLQVAEELARLRPEMRVLFMSGYTQNSQARNLMFHSGRPFLQKPFTSKALITKISEVLEAKQ